MKGMSRRLRYLWQMPFCLFGILVMLELLLQLGALWVKDQSRLVPAQWLTGHTRILALGDSNTYGLYLSEQEAWPFQLQQILNRENPSRPVEVLNLGYPGTNSYRVRENLPGLLDKLAPDIVLIMVGFNDFWTPTEHVDEINSKTSVDWLRDRSRVYRLYLIASRSQLTQQDISFGSKRDGSAVDSSNIEQHLVHMDGDSFYLGTREGQPARTREALPENLKAMVNTVRNSGANVYLLTYPSGWGFYPGANKWLRTVAQENATPLIDITLLFQARCQDGPVSCPDLLFHDGHARQQGNLMVANEVARVLLQQGK